MGDTVSKGLYDQVAKKKRELERALEEARKHDAEQIKKLGELKKEIESLNLKLSDQERKKKEAEAERIEKTQAIRKMAKDRGIDTINHFNIGIIGQSGTGKSSLLNAVLGKTHATSAKSGITEMTLVPQKYDCPNEKTMKIWDIPGAGTREIPLDNYFEKMSLFCFDYLVVVVGNRIMEWDSGFVERARKYDVSAVFVRSKSDQEVASVAQELYGNQYSDLNEDQKTKVRSTVKQAVKQYFDKELGICGLAGVLHYFVSSYAIPPDHPAFPKFDEERFVGEVVSTCVTRKCRHINIDTIEIQI